MRRDWAAWALGGALALLAALLLVRVWDNARIMAGLFNWPFQHDESESMIVAETLLLDHGVNIYAKLTPQQFIAAPYPPLYYLLNWPAIHLLGATFKVGRALSLAATLGVGALLVMLTRRLTGDWIAGLIAALAWAAIGMVGFWGVLVKPDMLTVALGLAGLLWVLRAAAGQGRVWGALPLFWAAFYSKQTAIAAAVAACVWLILHGWRRGLLFTILYAVGAGAGTLLLNWWTAGGYFYHEVTVHNLPWFPAAYWDVFSHWAGTYWPLLLPGLLGLGPALWRRTDLFPRFSLPAQAGEISSGSPRLGGEGLGESSAEVNSDRRPPTAKRRIDAAWRARAAHSWPALLAVGYTGMSLIMSSGAGTLGGNHNHLLDLTAALCWGLGAGVAALRTTPRRIERPLRVGIVLALCAGVAVLDPTPHWLSHEFRVLPRTELDGMPNVAQYTSNTAGPIYSTDLSVLLVTDKWRINLWTTDPYTQTHAASAQIHRAVADRWDESALVAAVRARYFSLVVLRFKLAERNYDPAGDLSPAMVQALSDSYQLDQANVLYLYKPKPLP